MNYHTIAAGLVHFHHTSMKPAIFIKSGEVNGSNRVVNTDLYVMTNSRKPDPHKGQKEFFPVAKSQLHSFPLKLEPLWLWTRLVLEPLYCGKLLLLSAKTEAQHGASHDDK